MEHSPPDANNNATERADSDVIEWGGGAQPARQPPSTSTLYERELNLASVNAPAVPFSVVPATRQNRRRRGSAGNGARGGVSRRSDDECEDADQDATEQAQVSSAAGADPARARRPSIENGIDYYERPDQDLSRAEHQDW